MVNQTKFNAEALIFDCDGTLVESMSMYWEAFEVICDRFGLNFSKEKFQSLAGSPFRRIVEIIIEEQESTQDIDVVVEVLCEEFEAVKKRRTYESIQPVLEIVKANYGKVPMAVASGGWKCHVLESLEEIGALKYFDHVVACEDVENPKPNPDIFLEAAKRLGVEPTKCVGFEDAVFGMQALKSAGMGVIDVKKLEGYPHLVKAA
eukprot:TRINITY_DN840_c0_g2_i3.p1 TRINITY_DN840_c0_g2~~TRINITY_DN840_c0_g2_i3.p1  ORF type:complete len:205 (-),score=81.91 TRINITY_DN840_c0_g2_i3:353-967(-)